MLRERDPARGYISRPPMIPAYLRCRLASDHRRYGAPKPGTTAPAVPKVTFVTRVEKRSCSGHHRKDRILTPMVFGSIHPTSLPAFSHRPRDGSVVPSRRCMNDPQLEGHHGKPHRTAKILSRARRRGRVAARGARAAGRADAAHRRAHESRLR